MISGFAFERDFYHKRY